MATESSTIPTNVVNPLGVGAFKGQTALLYQSKRRGHSKLSLGLASDSRTFSETTDAPVIMVSSRASESVADVSDTYLATVLDQHLLTYTRGGRLQLARRADFDDFDIGLWEHLPSHLPNAQAGIIVSEFKSKGRYVLYHSSRSLSVAFSRDLISWQTPARPLLTTRPDHFDRANLRIISAQLIAPGILVLYESVTYRRSQQIVSIGAALMARDDPTKLLWRSTAALWSAQGSRATGERALGAVSHEESVFVYFASQRGGWRLIELPLPNFKSSEAAPVLRRHPMNPVISPLADEPWQTAGTFNPAAVLHGSKVHLFYRALGEDGISRIGYALSHDGLEFERWSRPVYDHGAGFVPETTRLQTYSRAVHASGGGWGGTEDPRAVIIDDQLFLTFGVFESWQSLRMAVTSIPLAELHAKRWVWSSPLIISPPNETHKNWVLFPEKIRGKFAILHALTPTVQIEYVEQLSDLSNNPIRSNNQRDGRPDAWDGFVRGAAAPPLKTDYGWLLLYHGMDPAEPSIGYKVGAMLLDLDDPTKILHRSHRPLLVPDEWYENDWKPGVVYASGAVVQGDTLLIYYGGGDRHVCVASAYLPDFIAELRGNQAVHLEEVGADHVLR